MNNRLYALFSFGVSLFALIATSISYAEPMNLALNKQAIIQYHNNGQYQKEQISILQNARHYINQRLAAHDKSARKEKLAIVLDIDETSLSSYQNIVQRDFAATAEQIHQEIMAANLPPIQATLDLYRYVQKKGIAVFFVTGRSQSELQATQLNLLRAGYRDWTGLFLRPLNYHQPSIVPFKSEARVKITQQGYTIIASIGDQESDLRGGYAEKVFKLPNPFYYLS